MLERWEVMLLIVLGLVLVLALANIARIAFGGHKPKPDEHATHGGIG